MGIFYLISLVITIVVIRLISNAKKTKEFNDNIYLHQWRQTYYRNKCP